MRKFNLLQFKLAQGTGSSRQLRDDLSTTQLDRGMAGAGVPGFNPYNRKRKNQNDTVDNKLQQGDTADAAGGGPGPATTGVGSDEDRGDDARKQFDKWFKGHEYLWERQDSQGGPGSTGFMSDGEGMDSSASPTGGGMESQSPSPLSWGAQAAAKNDPQGYADNPNPAMRLPNGNGIRPKTKVELDRQPLKPVKAFNQSSRREQVGPLDMTWAWLKKGSK